MFTLRFVFFLSLFFLTACRNRPITTSPAEPEIVKVAYPPSLRTHVDIIHKCELATPNLAIEYTELPSTFVDSHQSDLVLVFGKPPKNGVVFQVSEAQIAVIINAANSVKALQADELREIFLGQITNWAELGGRQHDIRVWVFPNTHDVRTAFDSAVLLDEPITSHALLASDSQAMAEAIAGDPYAIGYISQDWLISIPSLMQIKTVDVGPTIADQLRQPVFMIANEEPDGLLQKLIACIQSNR